MGCGKTTLCRALNRINGIEVADLDELIEREAQCSIRSFWQQHGEARFRQLEESVLRRVAESGKDMVVACGGGTPCHGNNMAIMNRSGLTVWLQASQPVLLTRLLLAREQRPLIAAMDDATLSDYITGELKRREPHYSKAARRFNAERLEDERQIEQTATLFIKEFLS